MPHDATRGPNPPSDYYRPLALLLAIAMREGCDDPDAVPVLLDITRDLPPAERVRFIAAAEHVSDGELADLRQFLTVYLSLPPRKRRSTLKLVAYFSDRTIEERGRVIKALSPELPDREVAALVGVARETLVRRESYQVTKRLVAGQTAPASKFRGRVRRPVLPEPIDDD